MTKPPQFLFDECFSRPIVRQLAQFVANDPTEPKPVIKHLLDFYGEGVLDDSWIPARAEEGWVVITSDRAKRQTKHRAKLPIVCRQFGVTHVLISSTIHNMRSFDKGRMIIAAWPALLSTSLASRGSRYSLRVGSAGQASLVLMESPPMPDNKPDGEAGPGTLFD